MFYEKCFRFRLLKKSNASEFASAFSFFFKVLPLPQKFNRFRFHIPAAKSKVEKNSGNNGKLITTIDYFASGCQTIFIQFMKN